MVRDELCPRLPRDAPGAAEVIGMRVRDDDGVHVTQSEARALQPDLERLAAGLPTRFRGEGDPAAAGGAAPSVPGPICGLATLVEDAYTLKRLYFVTSESARPGKGCKCDDPMSRRVPVAAG